jgi:hypothetical protein
MNFTTRPSRRLRLAFAAALFAAHAAAEPVLDPTRPMAALLGEPAEAGPSKAPRAAAAAPAASAAPSTPRLQSVQTSANGASSALLDGRLVRVGDRVGEQSVAAIDRHGLTLRGPRGEQRLSLLTGITQTASRSLAPAIDTLATGNTQDKKP